jgi:hypothetical protein
MKKFAIAAILISSMAIPPRLVANPICPITPVALAAAPNNIIFLDADSKTVFVDLKSLDGAASDVKVKDGSGKVILTKDLAANRTDDVVELDMSKFEAGTYMVELNTYSTTLKQEINLQ